MNYKTEGIKYNSYSAIFDNENLLVKVINGEYLIENSKKPNTCLIQKGCIWQLNNEEEYVAYNFSNDKFGVKKNDNELEWKNSDELSKASLKVRKNVEYIKNLKKYILQRDKIIQNEYLNYKNNN